MIALHAVGEEVTRPYANIFQSFVQWIDAATQKPPSTFLIGYSILQEQTYENARDTGTVPAFDDRVLYLSTPLKNTFVWDSNEDMLSVMIGTDPVHKMTDELRAKYESKGLSAMIDEVTAKAKENGIE